MGFIGYSIDSIPLENVTDAVINGRVRGRISGLSSLIIVPMGGPAYFREGLSGLTATPNFFPALKPKDAIELQGLLFSLRDTGKREAGKVL